MFRPMVLKMYVLMQNKKVAQRIFKINEYESYSTCRIIQ